MVSRRFNLLKKTKNVLGSKNNIFYFFFAFLKSFSVLPIKVGINLRG